MTANPASPTRGTTPVTVVCGDGASELAGRLIEGLLGSRSGERVTVVSESGPPHGLDHADWLVARALEGDRTEGCPCCRVRLDLVTALRACVERPRPPARVIVVADPQRDLSTINQTLLSDPDLQRLVDLDGVITTVDAVALSTRLALDLPAADRNELETLAVADRIVVGRATDLTDGALGSVMRTLRTLNRIGSIAVPSVVTVDLTSLIGLRAWHGAPQIAPGRVGERVSLDPGAERPTTVHCEVDDFLDPAAIDEWFDLLVTQHGSRILRLQAAVAVRDQEHRVCCRGVKSFAVSHSEVNHPAERRSVRSEAAVVGYGLDAGALRDGFVATRDR